MKKLITVNLHRPSLAHRCWLFSLLLATILSSVSSLKAHQPPSGFQIEDARKRGDLDQRLEFMRQIGGNKMSDELVEHGANKIRAAAARASGENSLISMAPPAGRKGLPTVGSPKTLVILVDFADQRAPANPSPQDFSSNIFGFGTQAAQQYQPFESQNRYYYRASEGKLNITGNVLGWFHLPNNRSYYQPAQTGYLAQNQSIFNLMKSAMDYYNPSHDFSQYDNDGDGFIDAVTVLYTGSPGAWASFWWAYQWSFFVPDASTTSWDGVKLKKFVFSFVNTRASGLDYDPTVMIHETGHLLGLADYYDYTPSTAPIGGVGGLDPMHANRGNHNAFSRWLLDWITPEVIGSGAPSSRSLNASGDILLGSNNKAIALFPAANYTTSNSSSPFGEFFMVENRYRTGNDGGVSYMPSDGLVVWHVSSELLNGDFKNNNSDTNPKLLRLIQADGLNQIEKNGAQADAGDYFIQGKSFSTTSNPPSLRNNGSPSGVKITNISANGKVMTADVGFEGVSANLVATPIFSPLGGQFNSNVTVSIGCDTVGSTIRYTLDGSTPTSTSPIYTSPITLSVTGTVQAKAFKSGVQDSAVQSQTYQINSAIPLVDGVAKTNLAGGLQSAKIYVIDVPIDQTKLEITSAGGTGDLDLYVKRGATPSMSDYDYRPNLSGNAESVVVSNPQAGKWYVMVYGFNSYTGASLLADYSKVIVKVAQPVFMPSQGNYSSSLNVIMSTPSSGATIRYTTDKMDPTTNSPIYTSPINISTSTEFRAKAYQSGYADSDTSIGFYNITSNSGNITALSDGLALASRTGSANSMIFYKIEVPAEQTNLTIKTYGGTGDCDLYVKKGAVPSLTQFDYRPYLNGNNEIVSISNPQSGTWYIGLYGYNAYSAVSLLADYNKSLGNVALPVFSPTPGVYSIPQSVSITCSTDNATIRYTLNGTAPNSSSLIYSSPIGISATTLIKAKAFKVGFVDSPEVSANYTINTAPVITSLVNAVPVSASDTVGNSKLYSIRVPVGMNRLVIKTTGGTGDCDLYVKRGSQPTTSSYDYRPYATGNEETVEVISPTADDWFIMLHAHSNYSQVSLVASFSANVTQLPTPIASPIISGNYTASPLFVSISSQSGANVYYTTDNSTPTTSSPQYTAPIELATSNSATNAAFTVRAIAVKQGFINSPVLSQTYSINSSTTSISPNLSYPIALTFEKSKRLYKVTIPTGIANLKISTTGGTGNADMYVKAGAVATESLYDYKPSNGNNEELVSVNNPQSGDWYVMLLASSQFSGLSLSTNMTASLPVAATPVFTKASGNYSGSVDVGISSTTPDSVIRYTTDGSEPIESSAMYTSSLIFTASTTLKAKTFKNQHTPSPTATATYNMSAFSVELLTNGITKTSQSGLLNGVSYYKIVVPAGPKRLEINTASGAGDCDLFVKKGSLPTISTWDFKSANLGNIENLFIDIPGNGTQGIVSTLAGSGAAGSTDGNGTSASFYTPFGVAVDNSGNIYISDTNNHKIRKITSSGQVSTLAGSGSASTVDGNGTSASFNFPYGVAVDGNANVYVAEYIGNKIRKITPSGQVSTLAGSGLSGSVDGNGTSASFNRPMGVAVDESGNVYVAEYIGNKIRKIMPSGQVSTLAGSGLPGSVDGNGTSASFYAPGGIAVDKTNNLYIAEVGNRKIRKITPSGQVSTLAGSGVSGSVDGNGISASFNSPYGVAVDGNGNVYVAEYSGNKIRKITPSGQVSTLAGSGSNVSTDGDGTSASFSGSTGVAVNGTSNLYVSEWSGRKIRKISLGGGEGGEYFIMLRGSSAYSGVSLTAKYWNQIPVVSTPVFTPASGNFSQSINVSITSSTLSSQIRYTINGSEPTESSPLYTGTLSLSSTTNLKAKAFKVGSISSSTTSSTYTKLLNVIPLADGVPISGVTGLTGTFQYFKIVVPDNQSKLDIKTIGLNGDCELYVKQGSLPTTSDNQFKSTLSGSNENLTVENPQAGEYFIMLFSQATYSGLQLTADYSLVKAGIPIITPTAGTYNLQANISMQTSTTGAQIRYTTDNSTPTANSTLYNATISLSSNSTIKAIAFKSNYLNSDVATASFTITNITAQALTNNVAITSISGSANSEKHFYIDVPANQSFLTIKIFGGTGDCDLYVKKDGQATLESWQYRPFVDGNNESIIIPNPQAARYYIMLRGYAQYDGLNLKANYSSVLGQVATPVLTPPNGTSAATMLVNISCQTPNAVVKYTEDGTTPNGNSTTYTQPISVSASKTIKAIAMLSGYTDSSIVAGNFTITATQTANLTFNVPKLANSGNVNSFTFYKLTIPSGISGSVVVKTLGGTGDCDLYIKQGSLPSLTSYDQRPYLAGNNEEVVLQNVLPDQVYYIMLHGLQSYSGVALSATGVAVPVTDITLPLNLANWSVSVGGKYFARIYIAQTKNISIMTSGGVGDCDIYIKKDTIPSKSNYLARSINDGNQEQITLSGLTPGYYYIMVHAFEAFSGVTFEAKFTQ